jgi:hypothetical protein
MTTGNGITQPEILEQLALSPPSLPQPREAIVEQGLRIQQETAAERDLLRREVSGLKSDIAGYKVAIEALQAQLAEADSRMASMTLVRDEAVSRRAEVETVLASIMALGRAFSIKSNPIITGDGDREDISTMSANDRRIALDMAGSPERTGRGS